MKKVILTMLCMFACQQSAFALLPPFAQSMVELKAILNSKELAETFGMAENIQEIKKTEHGYIIQTHSQQVEVDVKYLPASRPGPAQFDLKFNHVTHIE